MKRNSSIATRSLPVTATAQIRTYAELQRRIRHDLRVQHPEWVKPNGESPICDLYERRLGGADRLFPIHEINMFAA